MDLTDKDEDSEYWRKAVSESISRRDNFFKDYKELLPARELERIRRLENEKPMNFSANKNVEALMSNPAFKFLMGGRTKKIIKDQKSSQAKEQEKKGEEHLVLRQEDYDYFKNLPESEKDD